MHDDSSPTPPVFLHPTAPSICAWLQVASRLPVFDQMILNLYRPGEGAARRCLTLMDMSAGSFMVYHTPDDPLSGVVVSDSPVTGYTSLKGRVFASSHLQGMLQTGSGLASYIGNT